MLITTFFSLAMVLAAFAAPAAVIAGIYFFLISAFTKRKLWKKSRNLIIAGVVLLALNPVAHQMVKGVAQSVSSGDSGARWIDRNAPKSGFIWNGTKYLELEVIHPWINADGEQRVHIMRPKREGELIDIDIWGYVFPDWVYPVTNDGGFMLYVHQNYLFCPEEQMDAALAYFQDFDDWDSLH